MTTVLKQIILKKVPRGARRFLAYSRSGVHVVLYHLGEGENQWEIFKFTKGKEVAIEARGPHEKIPEALVEVKMKPQEGDQKLDSTVQLLREGNQRLRQQ